MSICQITRMDGRSNAQVIADFIRHADPGRVFTHQEIASALSEGTDRTYGVEDVRSIVMGSYDVVLKTLNRALHSIRGVGYRVAHANDHKRLSSIRIKRADRQMKRALRTLTYVRWSEMDDNARQAHMAQQAIVFDLYHKKRAMHRRLRATEAKGVRLGKSVRGSHESNSYSATI